MADAPYLYTYLPPKNTADVDGILSTARAGTPGTHAKAGWLEYRARVSEMLGHE